MQLLLKKIWVIDPVSVSVLGLGFHYKIFQWSDRSLQFKWNFCSYLQINKWLNILLKVRHKENVFLVSQIQNAQNIHGAERLVDMYTFGDGEKMLKWPVLEDQQQPQV